MSFYLDIAVFMNKQSKNKNPEVFSEIFVTAVIVRNTILEIILTYNQRSVQPICSNNLSLTVGQLSGVKYQLLSNLRISR